VNLIDLAADILLAPYAMTHADLPPAAPPQPAPEPAMTVLCAWCKTVLKEGSAKVTHGICPPCRDRYFPTRKDEMK
jgi:hypothetical protein